MTKYNVTINGESGVVDPRLGSWENNILTKLPQQWRITIFMFIKTIPVEKLEINSYVIGEIKISPIEQEFKQSAFEDLRDAYLFLGKCSSTHHIYDTGNTWIVADQRDPKIEDGWHQMSSEDIFVSLSRRSTWFFETANEAEKLLENLPVRNKQDWGVYFTKKKWVVAHFSKIEDSWLTKEEAEYLAGSLGGGIL